MVEVSNGGGIKWIKTVQDAYFFEELERFSSKPISDIDVKKDTLATLQVNLEQFLNSVVKATRRSIIVHSYNEDTIQAILNRTL